MLVLEPGICFEEEIVEADGTVGVTANQVVVVHGEKDVDRARVDIELHDLLELLLSNLADTGLDLRNFPDKDLTILSASYGFLCVGQEDGFSVSLIFLTGSFFANLSSVVGESL